MRMTRQLLAASLCAAAALVAVPGTLLAQSAPARPATPQTPPASSAAPATDAKAQASFSIGLMMGQSLSKAHLKEESLSTQSLSEGLHAAFAGKELDPEAMQRVRSYVSSPTSEGKTRASYDMGLSMGQQLQVSHLGESSLSVQDVAAGVRAALRGQQPQEEDQQKIHSYLQVVLATLEEKNRVLAEKNSAKVKAFLAANGKKPGVVTTKSGLQYKILSPGSGQSPKSTDTVSVRYRGTLLDGTEFDGTDLHGNEPLSLALTDVIKGWQEALTMMKPGAKWEVYIPPDLGYGANSEPPIPPGSLLVFRIELVKVARPTAPPQGH